MGLFRIFVIQYLGKIHLVMVVGDKELQEYKRFVIASPIWGLDIGDIIYEGIHYNNPPGYYFTKPPGFGGYRVAPARYVIMAEGSYVHRMSHITTREYNQWEHEAKGAPLESF